MYKQVMLLGLLLDQPMYGQQIREVIETHHDLFAEHIKKPTIYYQLDRLAQDGYLDVRRETVEAPGPGQAHDELAPREREVYHITDAGRSHFLAMLRDILRGYTPDMSDMDVALFFLPYLPSAEAAALLEERRAAVSRTRLDLEQRLPPHGDTDIAHHLVNDRLRALLDAEQSWLDRTIAHLRAPRGRPIRAETAADGSSVPAPGHL